MHDNTEWVILRILLTLLLVFGSPPVSMAHCGSRMVRARGSTLPKPTVVRTPSGDATVYRSTEDVSVPESPAYKDPWKLYEGLRKHLQAADSSSGQAAPIHTRADLEKKLADLKKRHADTYLHEKKQEIRKTMERVRQEVARLTFLGEAGTRASRRRRFIDEVVGALLALCCMDKRDLKDAYTIFRCGHEQTKADFVRILADLPSAEVAPVLWERLSGQLRFNTQGLRRKWALLEEQLERLTRRIQALQTRSSGGAEEEAAKAIRTELKTLAESYDEKRYDSYVLRAAIDGRNREFISRATDLLAGFGPRGADTVVRDVSSPREAIRERAETIVRRIGKDAAPALLKALKDRPTQRLASLLKEIAPEALERLRLSLSGSTERAAGRPGEPPGVSEERGPE